MKQVARKRILDAAVTVFIDKGFDGARVEAIARQAKVNKAMIYYYFSSKDQLYYQVLKTTFTRIMGRIMGALDQEGSSSDRIHQMIREWHGFICEHRHLPKLILRELANGAPVMQQVLDEVLGKDREKIVRRITDNLAEGYRTGTIRQVDPIHTMLSLMGMVVFPFIAAPLLEPLLVWKGGEQFWRERPDAIIDLLFQGIQRRDIS